MGSVILLTALFLLYVFRPALFQKHTDLSKEGFHQLAILCYDQFKCFARNAFKSAFQALYRE